MKRAFEIKKKALFIIFKEGPDFNDKCFNGFKSIHINLKRTYRQISIKLHKK